MDLPREQQQTRERFLITLLEAAIPLKGVLIAGRTANIPVDILTGLKNSQRRCVAADVRQINQRFPAEACADRSVHRLQLGANRHGNLDGL